MVVRVVDDFGVARGEAAVGLRPQALPGDLVTIGRVVGVAEIGCGFDRVVVRRIAAEIGGSEICLRALVHIVKAPILAVEIEVIVDRVAAELAQVQLGLPVENIADKNAIACVATEGPRIVVGAAEVEFIELGHGCRVAAEECVIQGRRPVGIAEKETEAVLWISRAATESATQTQAAVCLKFAGAGLADEFDGGCAFPCDGVSIGVGVDPIGVVEEEREVGDDGDAGDRLHVIENGGAVGGRGGDVRVYTVVENLPAAHAAGPCGGGG